eukprot:gene972-1149_t
MGKATPDTSIKVGCRMRPFIAREQGESCAFSLTTSQVQLDKTIEGATKKPFVFDRVFDSLSTTNPASQDIVYKDFGEDVVVNVFNGFNGCLFVYGQTGSGKSWTMFGGEGQPGMIPRMAQAIIAKRAELSQNNEAQLDFYVSFLEIYNEKCTDLLANGRPEAKLREDPKLGVFVPGLKEMACATEEDVQKTIDLGTKHRTVAQTKMNNQSSRSHAVLTYKVNIKKKVGDDEVVMSSKLNLIDLAGSERADKTGAQGERLKEGSCINQSLSTLGMVIRELNEAQNGKKVHVQFRSSKLTYLLRDSLTGNCKTFMTVHMSPAVSNVEETISTLRFGSSVKNLKTRAVVNMDPKDKMLEDLREQIAACRAELEKQGITIPAEMVDNSAVPLGDEHGRKGDENADSLEKKEDNDPNLSLATPLECIGEHAKRMDLLTGSFGRKVLEARKHHTQCLADMQKMGLSTKTIEEMGVESDIPYFVNISNDPLMDGQLIYYLPREMENNIGRDESENQIVLKGPGILPRLCSVYHNDAKQIVMEPKKSESDGKIGKIIIQGRGEGSMQVTEPTVLKHGDSIALGYSHLVRYHDPKDKDYIDNDKNKNNMFFMGDDLEQKISLGRADENNVTVPVHAVDSLAYLMPTWKRRFGSVKAQDCAKQLLDLFVQVDEANSICEEMLDEPQVWEVRCPVAKMPEMKNMCICLSDDIGGKALLVETAEKFMRRVERLRDVHHQWQSDGSVKPWKAESITSNPFIELRKTQIHEMVNDAHSKVTAEVGKVKAS